MAETAQSTAHVAGQRPHIGALAAFGVQYRVIGVGGGDQLQPGNFYRAGLKFHHLAVAGEVIGALAVDLDGGIARRHLLDGAGIGRQQSANGLRRGALIAAGDGAAFGVVGVPFLAPAHGKLVELAAVHHEGNGLGRFAERDRQAAGGERVEGASMAGALGREQALHHADRMGGGHADRLVEHQPAMHIALVTLELFFGSAFMLRSRLRRLLDRRRIEVFQIFFGHLSSSCSRSRLTAGERSSLSMRSASSKRSSTRKRISGANFRLTWWAISPRRNFLWRSKAASTSSVSRPASRMM